MFECLQYASDGEGCYKDQESLRAITNRAGEYFLGKIFVPSLEGYIGFHQTDMEGGILGRKIT